ncbi:hypothetical protein GGR56DRAFT_689953 [Xylariaceae sp. FL0804]|nr:hypothetical protein GGR56DRAFT_689953 [Xylariaceae sp. FL0804]
MGQSSLLSGIASLDLNSVFVLFVTVCAFLIPVLIILPPVGITKSDALLQTHSTAGVARAQSNLGDQYDPKHASSGDGSAGPPRVHSLLIYPVKSCRGIELTRSRVLPQGLQFDRLFTFAQLKSQPPTAAAAAGGSAGGDGGSGGGGGGGGDDGSSPGHEQERQQQSWHFITQRQFPRLATVKVDLWLPDDMKLRKQSLRDVTPRDEAFLVLRFPWRSPGWRGLAESAVARLAARRLLFGGGGVVPEREVLLPVGFPSAAEIRARGYAYEEVRVWNDTARALNLASELPDELRAYLGVDSRLGLFRIDPEHLREVYRCAPREPEAGYQPVTGFQDAFPLHMLNLGSVQQFSSEVPKDEKLKQLDVRRFRANIILSGAPAYDEESWKRARFKPQKGSGLYNDAIFHVSCRTVRCKLPNVDQDSGVRHPSEPDRSLRSRRDVDEGAPRMGCLGMQLTPLFDESLGEDRESWVAVGMAVEVEERGHHVYIKQGTVPTS